jgi:transposase
MPRPYSVDLRERALLACEHGEGSCSAVARRFRIGVSTLRLWRQQARDEGRRAPRRMGRARSPLGGHLRVLAALAAAQPDATLAEYAERFAARTGTRRSVAVICKALQQLGWVRKQKRSGPASRIGRMSQPPAAPGGPRQRGLIRHGSSASPKAALTPVSSAPRPAPRAGSGRTARRRAGTGGG